MAVGAEASREGIYDMAEEGDWTKVRAHLPRSALRTDRRFRVLQAEWFKLHLRGSPSAPGAETVDLTSTIPPLPPGKDITTIMGDYLKYMLHCAMLYVRDTQPGGLDLWFVSFPFPSPIVK